MWKRILESCRRGTTDSREGTVLWVTADPPLVTDTKDRGMMLCNAKGTVPCECASVTPACLHWAVPPALSSLLGQLLPLGQARVQPERDANSPCRSPAPLGLELKHAFPAYVCFLHFKSIFVSNHGSCWLQIQHQKQRQQPYRDCLPSSYDSMGWIPMINPLFSIIHSSSGSWMEPWLSQPIKAMTVQFFISLSHSFLIYDIGIC